MSSPSKRKVSWLILLSVLFTHGAGMSEMTSERNSETPQYNRLSKERSPYLLQHAANPVDWYAWGPEAFQKAREEGKLIFLSIGYSTCHWCHVMEHESFEDAGIAGLLNADFVSIKVDREERPDIDHIYMTAVQAMTGQGGWPLSVFLTPDLKPIAGGTYFPPEDRWGRPGLRSILPKLAEMWKARRQELEASGQELTRLLEAHASGPEASEMPGPSTLDLAFRQYVFQFDPEEGGFGQAPKFPTSHNLSLLLRYWKRSQNPKALEMVQRTLEAMARGGICDQLGGGFHRYATDAEWLVPHFEKMLYDQAMLARTYLEAYQVTGEESYAAVARDIFQYVLRDLRDPRGGFYSAEDADSEGREGIFYVWGPEEIRRHLGRDAEVVMEYYGIREEGNFEDHTSILHVPQPMEAFAKSRSIAITDLRHVLARARARLLEIRSKRIRPLRDDKILTAWNGLMISAFALGAQALQEKSFADTAAQAARFVLDQMRREGRLLRRYRDGEAAIAGFHEDYAYFTLGLLDLYEATGTPEWLREAKRLTEIMIDLFWDEAQGGFYSTARDAEPLITRPKESYDGAIPSGNSVSALLLLRLAHLFNDSKWEDYARRVIRSNSESLASQPTAYAQMLAALDFALGPTCEIVVAGDPRDSEFQSMVAMVQRRFVPRRVLIQHPSGEAGREIRSVLPMIKEQGALNGKPTVYVCENFVCKFPITDKEELQKKLDGL